MSDPTPERASNGLPFVVRIVGGIVLVALVVGVGLWAERLTDDDLALPDEVAGVPLDASKEGRALADGNSDRLSEAFDGAEAVTGRYGVDSDSPFLVTAVRADTGPPLPGWFDEENELVDEGDVTCLVSADTLLCQRSDGDLTVRVLSAAATDLDQVVDATEAVWEDVS